MKNKNYKSNQVHEFSVLVLNSILKNLEKIGLPSEDISQLQEVFDTSLPQIEKLPEHLRSPFQNFVANAIIFSILWNEEIETCLEFPEWLKDLVLYLKRLSGEEVPPKKKQKKTKN